MKNRLSNIQFLEKHSYSTKNMTECTARDFIIEQSEKKMPYRYMVLKARQLKKKIKDSNIESNK